MSHFDSIEGINWSFRSQVIEREEVNVGVRIERIKKLSLVRFEFWHRMDFVSLEFFFFGDIFNGNVSSRNDGFSGGMG